MLRSLDWYVLLSLGAAALWILLAVVIGFMNMLGSVVSRWRTRVAVTYDKLKMEKKWQTPNLARQAAYRLDLAEYDRSYEGYDKRQSDIRVCTLHSSERRCSLAAAESLTAWVREVLVELEERALDQEKEAFVESLLELLAKGQEALLRN